MTVRFSTRTGFDRSLNALSRRRAELEQARRPLVDLTLTNPTTCGLAILEPVLPVISRYEPEPRGLLEAREAVGTWWGAPAEHVVLSASTSEAYGWLFKLLCDPGDEVLVPAPCYPLFDFLTRLEGVATRRYPLRWSGARWELDVAMLESEASERTRAVLVVSPANPTGQLLAEEERHALGRLCTRRGWALIVDEVFHDPARHGMFAGNDLSCLTFSLGGLSKLAGLPQLKLAWTVVSGPDAVVDDALGRIELVADTSLSVASPVQHAARGFIERSPEFLARVARRVEANARVLAGLRGPGARWDVLPVEGGWSQVLRVGEQPGEEALCLAALDRGVIVQPGYFYDFPSGAWLVLSLLPEPWQFEPAARTLAALLDE